MWFKNRSTYGAQWLERQEFVIKLYTLAPFLFGQTHQDDLWIIRAKDMGLLSDDYNGLVAGC